MNTSWKTEWPHWLLLAGMFLVAAVSWSGAPDRMPVHWNLAGEVDGYGGKFEGILLLPLISVTIYLLLLFAPRIDPGGANYAVFKGAYTTIRLLVLLLMAGIYAVMNVAMRGVAMNVGGWIPFLIGAMCVVLGNLMGKLRPNWFIGIRTPGTLSSKLSWSKTHRAGGWVFILMGLAMMASGLIAKAWAFTASMVLLIGGSVGLAIYSYLVWRTDPDKTPPAGTSPA